MEIVTHGLSSCLHVISIQPTILDHIREAQLTDPKLVKIRSEVAEGKRSDYTIYIDGYLRLGKALVVPNDVGLKTDILREAHSSPYSIHPSGTKVYQDLHSYYSWVGMKRDIVEFVQKFLQCQQVKAEHQRPFRLLHPVMVPMWK